MAYYSECSRLNSLDVSRAKDAYTFPDTELEELRRKGSNVTVWTTMDATAGEGF
jgi:hypothetical protein